jgi:hypothetical protein
MLSVKLTTGITRTVYRIAARRYDHLEKSPEGIRLGPWHARKAARQSTRAGILRWTTIASIGDLSPRSHCLMRNYVHLPITPLGLKPAGADELRATFAEAHRRYTGAINCGLAFTAILTRLTFVRFFRRGLS